MSEPIEDDPFVALLAEMADGQRWAVLRAEGFDDFVLRLTGIIGALPPRRRQAVIMLLFGLVEGFVTPEEADAWIASRAISTDQGVEDMIAWLRDLRRRRP
ncbi:MAG: hypothetical protein ACRD0J_17705 [Acidimicrobiales bacterium]